MFPFVTRSQNGDSGRGTKVKGQEGGEEELTDILVPHRTGR